MASGALVLDRSELWPGAEVAVSVMLPIDTEWWFRPVSSAWRVGAQRLWCEIGVLQSPAARLSAVGVWHGPPKALDAPKPMSSNRMTNTFGAPWRQQRLDGRELGVGIAGVIGRQTHLRAVWDWQHRTGHFGQRFTS